MMQQLNVSMSRLQKNKKVYKYVDATSTIQMIFRLPTHLDLIEALGCIRYAIVN